MNPHNGTKILVHGRREIWGSRKQLEVPSSNFIRYLVLETTGYDRAGRWSEIGTCVLVCNTHVRWLIEIKTLCKNPRR
jgi:hypothetical protein